MSKQIESTSSNKRSSINEHTDIGYVRKKDRINELNEDKKEYKPILNTKCRITELHNDDIEINEDLKRTFSIKSKIPTQATIVLKGHTNVVNNLRWHPIYGHLLASSSLDHTARLWSVYPNKGEIFSISHNEGIKDVRWTCDGTKLITGGLDSYVNLTDVEKQSCIHSYKHNEWITSLCAHPSNPALFLSGGANRGIVCWDSRVNSIVAEYFGSFGEIQDMCFLDNDGNSFLSSANIIKRNSSDQGLIVWDCRTGAKLSNQIYMECYSCTCVRKHPTEKTFVAETQGDYIALFESFKPYRLNRRKRYQGHKVRGNHINLSFSKDGHYIATGSATGSLYFYDYYSSKIIKSLKVFQNSPCLCAEYHPLLTSTVAISNWEGKIAILQ